jgi:hypothetical protein
MVLTLTFRIAETASDALEQTLVGVTFLTISQKTFKQVLSFVIVLS